MYFIARAYDSKIKQPDIMAKAYGGWVCSDFKPLAFTSIGIDQTQEHKNKGLKCVGGLRGITTKPSALLKYCLASPVLSDISQDMQKMFGIKLGEEPASHHKDSVAHAER